MMILMVTMIIMMMKMIMVIMLSLHCIQAVDIEQCLGEGESCRNQDDAPSYGETVCR